MSIDTLYDWEKEVWEKEAHRILVANPNATVDDLTEWFGKNNFGYFPTIIDLRRVIRNFREEK